MLTSRVQCHGCDKWFSPRGLSQHVSKTQDTRCRDTVAASQVSAVSSSIQNAATQPWLSPNCASPVSRGSSPDSEFDHTTCGQLSDTEIAVTQDDALGLEGILNDPLNPADVADADAYEELLSNNPPTIFPDQMTAGEAPGSPELTEYGDQSEVGNQADLTLPQGMSTHVVDGFPLGHPGMPIPDKPHGPSAYQSWQATFTDSPWAPFQSERDWDMARWLKMRGQTSAAVMEIKV
ncbi:hypothetical protein F5888DRAFT_1808868 [Russula emetica]|nr:hypothetical protein F5888DRAFT_1808868 [Russula emetica]